MSRILFSKQSFRCQFSTVAQRAQLRPNDILRNAPHSGGRVEPTIRPRQQPARIAEHTGNPFNSVSDYFRMLDKIRQRVDHARNQQLTIGQRDGLQHAKLMRVARIGEWQEDRACFCLKDFRQDVAQCHVVIVGPS